MRADAHARAEAVDLSHLDRDKNKKQEAAMIVTVQTNNKTNMRRQRNGVVALVNDFFAANPEFQPPGFQPLKKVT